MNDPLAVASSVNVPIESLRRYLAIRGWSRNEHIGPALDLFTLRQPELEALEVCQRNRASRTCLGGSLKHCGRSHRSRVGR